MSNTFGTCKQDTVTWFKTFDERGCAIVTFYPPGQTALDCPEVDKSCTLLLDPVKGAVIVEQDGSETEIPLVDGILQLPYDMFGTVELSGTPGEPDYTATVTLPGQEPFEVCLKPVKDVLDADGNSIVDENGVAQLPPSSFATPVDTDGDGVVDIHIVTAADDVETPVCLRPVKSVTGPFVDNTDPQNPIVGIPADLRIIDIRIVEGPEGTYNWEVDVGPGDGTVTETLNAGPVIDTDTFGTAVDNGDGTTTQTNPDGSTLVSCNNPVKSAIEQADGSTLVTYADDTTNTLSAAVDTDTLVQDADGNPLPIDPVTGLQQLPAVTTKVTDDLTCGRVGSIEGCDLWDQPLPVVQGCVTASASGEEGLDQLTITESSYGTHVGQTVDSAVADITFADGTTIDAQALTSGGDTVVALTPEQIALLNHPIKILITATDCNGQVATGIAA